MTLSATTHNATRQTREIGIVKEVVAVHYGYSIAVMVAEDRSQPIALYRQVAMAIARDLTGASFPDLSRAFARKNHCTIMHACKTVRAKVEANNSTLAKDFSILRERARLMIKKSAGP